jgi:hypothetical protein
MYTLAQRFFFYSPDAGEVWKVCVCVDGAIGILGGAEAVLRRCFEGDCWNRCVYLATVARDLVS